MRTMTMQETDMVSGGLSYLDWAGYGAGGGGMFGAVIGYMATGTLSGAATGASGFGAIGGALGAAGGLGWAIGSLGYRIWTDE